MKRSVSAIEFQTMVRQSGNSGHIIVPSSLVGKQVQVSIKVVEEDYNAVYFDQRQERKRVLTEQKRKAQKLSPPGRTVSIS